MNYAWVEVQFEELLKAKNCSKILSPHTVLFIDRVIGQCGIALSEPFETQEFGEIRRELELGMPYLQKQIENDEIYGEELLRFQRLCHESILFKHGKFS